LVKSNWDAKVQQPIAKAADSASDSATSVKDWIFNRYRNNDDFHLSAERELIFAIAGVKAASSRSWIIMAFLLRNHVHGILS
jgi:hypothetical protein